MTERFLRAYRLELRQIFRQWSYWLIQGLLVAYIVSTYGRYSFSAQELLWAGAGRNVMGIGTLLALMFAAFSAGRARRNHAAVLEDALPVGAEVQLGRLFALMTAMLPFMASGIIVAWMAGPAESFWRGLPVYVLESGLSLAFVVLAVWLLDVTVGIRRWMYILLVMLWLGAIFTVMASSHPVSGAWVMPLNFTRLGYSGFNVYWERTTQGAFPWLLNGFYAGLVVLLFGLIVWAVQRRRLLPVSPLVYAITGGGLLIALGCYGVYGVRYMQTNWRVQFYNDPLVTNVYLPDSRPEPLPYAVTRYDIALDVSETPAFVVEMDVLNTGDAPLTEVSFALLDALHISTASVPYEHADDRLTLKPETPLAAGETLTVRLSYGGEVAFYSYIMASAPEMSSFITPYGIGLHHAVSWYPRVGISEMSAFNVNGQPAHIRLAVTGTDLTLVSNLGDGEGGVFEADDAYKVWLAGSPLIRTYSLMDGVTVIATDAIYPQLKLYLTPIFTQSLLVLKRYFPEEYRLGSPWERWNPYLTGNMSSEIIYALVADLLHADSSSRLASDIAFFIALQVQYDDADVLRGVMAKLSKREFESGMSYSLFHIYSAIAARPDTVNRLIDVYAAHGMDGTVPLVTAMRAAYARLYLLPQAEVVAWMDAWIAENLGDV